MESKFPNYPLDHRLSCLALPVPVVAALRTAADQTRTKAAEASTENDLLTKPSSVSRLGHPHALTIGKPRLPGRGAIVSLIKEQNLRETLNRATIHGARDKQTREHAARVLVRVGEQGLHRRVRHERQLRNRLAHLREQHPNFHEVLRAVEMQLELARASRLPVRLTPMLLDGPPGVGKTYFAQRLAEALGAGFLRISMETAQTASELTGSAEHWGNSQAGRLFDLLVEGAYANPVVLLDEVDKAGGTDSHRADRALYALLERESAKVWSDLSFPTLQLDASYVTFVLTSNVAGRVPSPLRSRMQIFSIAPLEGKAAREMVRMIFRQEVAARPKLRFEPTLHVGLCDRLAHLSPREIARASQLLIASAVVDQRRMVTADDLQALGSDTSLLGRLEARFGSAMYGTMQ